MHERVNPLTSEFFSFCSLFSCCFCIVHLLVLLFLVSDILGTEGSRVESIPWKFFLEFQKILYHCNVIGIMYN